MYVLQITQDVQSNPLRCDSAFHIIKFQKNLVDSNNHFSSGLNIKGD